MPTRRCSRPSAGQLQMIRGSTLMIGTSLYLRLLLLTLGAAVVQPCRTEFDSVQDRALVSQYVIVGRIDALRPPSTSGGVQVARVTVLRVLKDGGGGGISIRSGATGVLTVDSTDQLEVFGYTDRSASQPKECTTAVAAGDSYFLFFNSSTNGPAPYSSVKLAARYSKKDEDALNDALCTNCATVPRVRTRKTTEANAGNLDIVLTCTVESVQQVRVGWYKGGRDLAQNLRFQLQRKENRKRRATVLMAKLKQPQPSDAGEYTCIARNALGSSSASLRLTAASFPPGPVATFSSRTTAVPTTRTVAPSAGTYGTSRLLSFSERAATSSSLSWTPTTPAEAVSSSLDTTSRPSDSSPTAATITSAEATTASMDLSTMRSHYVGCADKDTKYCLHGGICLMKPDGRDRHCRCVSQHAGARCEEKLIQWTFRPPAEVSPHVGDVKNDVIAALATALGVVLVAVCIGKLACGKQPCVEWRPCRNARGSLNVANASASVPLLATAQSKCRPSDVDGGVCEQQPCSSTAAASDGLQPLLPVTLQSQQQRLVSQQQPVQQSWARRTVDQACQTEAVISASMLPFSAGCTHAIHLAIEEPAPAEASDAAPSLRLAALPCVCCCNGGGGSTAASTDLGRQAGAQSPALGPDDTDGHVDRSSEKVMHTETDIVKASCDHRDGRRGGAGGSSSSAPDSAAAAYPIV